MAERKRLITFYSGEVSRLGRQEVANALYEALDEGTAELAKTIDDMNEGVVIMIVNRQSPV